MKRIHINIRVNDLPASVAFYTALFGTGPTTRREDYAKWMLDDPRVNFALTRRAGTPGIEHLGIQAEDEAELQQLYAGIAGADAVLREEGHTVCCYAQSEKSWVKDPQGVEWEVFRSYGESDTFYGEDPEAACCGDTCCA
ncbi:glyoxalase/bleomycin resistance/dioxygenase family protein [Rhodothermaceae bacterium RA]|nr:glyoxalase/bleomycin resistance/dioxygenase family protein [Rhodothermaceae bacterium RA]